MNGVRMFGLHAHFGPITRRTLAAAPFLAVIIAYGIASHLRLSENPSDRLLPSFITMAETFWRYATVPDRRSGALLLWSDTFASLARLLTGIGAAAVTGCMIGLNTALFPLLRNMFAPFLIFLSIIPPLTLLPILFIAFGVGETAKIVLIFVGTVFVIGRDIQLYVQQMPREQITKALTLGASQFGVAYRVILPQVAPRLINSVRLALGAAWLFLIAAEMISATEGLGYRIGLSRRYLAMDVIIPYVLWITALGVSLDVLLRMSVSRLFPWYKEKKY